MKRQAYPAYKDSGVEWLGKVPEGWSVAPLKRVLARNDGGVWGKDFADDGSIVLRSTEIALDGSWQIVEPARRQLSARERSEARLEAGDLLVTKSSGSTLHLGKTAIVTDDVAAMDCCYSNFMQRLRANARVQARYLFWILNCSVGRDQLVFLGTTTTGLANLSARIIGAVQIPLLPIPEQRAIVTFLDQETERINDLIAKKERQIELLLEKRVALISNAVIKGLDPSVQMKDSGIRFLGEIPTHWNLVRSKAIFYEVDERSESGDEELLTVSHMTGVTPRSDVEVNMFLPETFRGYKKCKRGDLVINTMWAWMGALGISEYVGIVSPSYNVYRFREKDKFVPKYLDLLYRTPPYTCEIGRHSKGIWKSRLRLYPESFFEMRSLKPPLSEQRKIVVSVTKEALLLDGLVGKLRESIGTLEEYRNALISAAVTGKIDVRNKFEVSGCQ